MAHATEGLDSDMLQQIIGRAVIKHGFELVNKSERSNEPELNLSHIDTEGVLQASQVMVKPYP